MRITDAMALWVPWMRDTRNLRPSTVHHHSKTIRNLSDQLHWLDVEDITAASIMDALHNRYQNGVWSAATCLAYLNSVRSFVKWCKDHGHVEDDPVAALRWKERDDDTGSRALRAEEVAKLIHCAKVHEARVARSYATEMCVRSVAYALLWHTGIRSHEAESARWTWIDWKVRRLNLPAMATKARKSRWISLNAEILGILEAYRAANPRLGDDDRLFPVFVTRQTLKNDCQRCRIAGRVTFHSFRKGFISALIGQGVPAEVIATQTGHTSVEMMLRHYIDPQIAGAEDAVVRMPGVWGGPQRPSPPPVPEADEENIATPEPPRPNPQPPTGQAPTSDYPPPLWSGPGIL